MRPTTVSAVYRRSRRQDWREAEIVGDHESGGLVMREVGRFWPGLWLEARANVRIAGPEFVPT